jgi:hypothetical protein
MLVAMNDYIGWCTALQQEGGQVNSKWLWVIDECPPPLPIVSGLCLPDTSILPPHALQTADSKMVDEQQPAAAAGPKGQDRCT